MPSSASGAHAREHRDAGLGRRVDRVDRHREQRRHRRGVDDRSPTTATHGRDDQTRAEDNAAQVDVHDPQQRLWRDVGPERLAADETGVVVEDVDATVLGLGGGEQRFERTRLRDVGAGEGRGAPTSCTRPTVSAPPTSSMSATTTAVPSFAKASAVARPMPDPAPVTTATFPRSSNCLVASAPASRPPVTPPLHLLSGRFRSGVPTVRSRLRSSWLVASARVPRSRLLGKSLSHGARTRSSSSSCFQAGGSARSWATDRRSRSSRAAVER